MSLEAVLSGGQTCLLFEQLGEVAGGQVADLVADIVKADRRIPQQLLGMADAFVGQVFIDGFAGGLLEENAKICRCQMHLIGKACYRDLLHVLFVNDRLNLADDSAGVGFVVSAQQLSRIGQDVPEKLLLLHVGRAFQPVLYKIALIAIRAVGLIFQAGYCPRWQKQQKQHEIILLPRLEANFLDLPLLA